ncbi:formimidoylglutamate deiminase [Nocardia seriolae]|uniref:Formiminoglutamate deiminase n=1 Tax=Nocardia seriolae TaxID=37332 RepID=A0ABC9YYR3_9NOCA|nr:formimidoylglutamate deiminase [Nocardia seriolae]OJF82022.1 formimidoylglutamate deiminase [Nocardia seriolae]PSK28879.1 formimidoylglutamate deiminase [Nocardia seriolae]QOW33893.1 formimidoylglutamate deiminase [Nocardia seriolae]QUN18613.1 formimidoylglutamate deiminase [Nocardia seriolae]WNJ61096.1 formimidoylglutamate deiminase [Nocardia seriolae]
MTTYWCARAWLPGGVAEGVRIDVAEGVVTAVSEGEKPCGTTLPGLVVPGFANAHSHAFHRALRGRTHADRGSFWTWRERMYAVARRLEPDSYYRLARAVYAEMVLAGYTSVAEFHYLHHPGHGQRYADPNEFSHALVAAAADAGIRLTLLDVCYLAGGFGRPTTGVQQRFDDGDADAWARRIESFDPAGDLVVTGAAIHSVRAVPAEQLPAVVHGAAGRPLHVHLSEQPRENEECLAVHGCTPTQLLSAAGALTPRTTAVHATHLTPGDIAELSGCWACLCPSTEADLGDGIGLARALADAGARLALGSDGQSIIDPWFEARALEFHERLASGQRGRFDAHELLSAATAHAASGWSNQGAIAPGRGADLVCVDTCSPRTAGVEGPGILFAATSSDVTDVMIAGRWVVRDRVHRTVTDVPAALQTEIGALWQ